MKQLLTLFLAAQLLTPVYATAAGGPVQFAPRDPNAPPSQWAIDECFAAGDRAKRLAEDAFQLARSQAASTARQHIEVGNPNTGRFSSRQSLHEGAQRIRQLQQECMDSCDSLPPSHQARRRCETGMRSMIEALNSEQDNI